MSRADDQKIIADIKAKRDQRRREEQRRPPQGLATNTKIGIDNLLDLEKARHDNARKVGTVTLNEEGATLQSVRASDVTMKAIDWLWPYRFALHKLGLLVGLPDEGKGQVLSYIAARITSESDKAWPCNEGRAPLGNVILLTAEDDLDDTVVPRLKAAGADLNRVEIVKMVQQKNGGKRMFSLLSDLELLRQKIVEVGDVVLVLIDPISAYLGVRQMDSFRTNDVRAALAPLVDLASETNVAIIGVMHFNKKLDITNVMLRISDSLAYGATARHVYGVINDAENKRKLLVRGKNNLVPRDQSNKALAYHFGVCEVGIDHRNNKPINSPYVIWEPSYIDVTASEAMQAALENKSPAARDEAKKFLRDLLANGPMAVKEIEDAAKGNGFAWRTIERAKREIKIVARKTGLGSGWTWELPPTPSRHWNDDEAKQEYEEERSPIKIVGSFKNQPDVTCVHCGEGADEKGKGQVLKIAVNSPGAKHEPLHGCCARLYFDVGRV